MMCGVCEAATERREAAELLLHAVRARSPRVPEIEPIFRPVPIGPEWWTLLRRFDRQI